MVDFNEEVRIVSEHKPIKKGLPPQKWKHITLSQNGDIVVGGGKEAGDISVRNVDNKEVISLHGGSDLSGTGGILRLGGQGTDGRIFAFPASATGALNPLSQGTLFFNADGRLFLGGNSKNGYLQIFPSSATKFKQNQATILINGDTGNIKANGKIHAEGNINCKNVNAVGDINCKNAEFDGDINCKNANLDNAIVKMDVKLLGADCAEEFPISDSCHSSEVEPGNVMVLTEGGKLTQSRKSYDNRVAGVVSGAGNFRPAIIMDREIAETKNRAVIALMGKVYCKVDASTSEIKVGDMLTTSDTPGHAMKAIDRSKSFGSILGKSLQRLKSGNALIPILVTLQ